jgi:60 kDa SS-A/Ro ribonucleoprotein
MATKSNRSGYGVIFNGMSATTADAQTPQTEMMSAKQVENSAGGFVFAVDDMTRLRRFLVLGADGGSYYATERQLKLENAQCIGNLLAAGRAQEVVTTIVECSEGGRAAKQDATIFALAVVARLAKTAAERKVAFEALHRVCRIPTHLFSFIANTEQLVPGSSGWGRMMRDAVGKWYNNKKPRNLATAITKYQQRDGWSHKDVLRLAHVKPADRMHNLLFKYSAKGWEAISEDVKEIREWAEAEAEGEAANERTLNFLMAVEAVKTADEARACELIREHGLVREHLPTEMLSSATVWEALLAEMPMTALMRNLNKLTQVGLLVRDAPAVEAVAARFSDVEQLRAARLHPLNILVAMRTYARGHGDKGKLTWEPNPQIVAAIERAFYGSFSLVVPTGKRFVLALDVSGSMGYHNIGGMGISCAEAATAMAMATIRTEPMCCTMAFGDKFHTLNLKPSDALDSAIRKTSNLPFGATDCSLPMQWALSNKVKADVFVVYTDSETYAGKLHPVQALRQYRAATGIPAKLIVVGMVSNGFTIADPDDAGMMDVVGFDSAAPEVMRSFAAGEI